MGALRPRHPHPLTDALGTEHACPHKSAKARTLPPPQCLVCPPHGHVPSLRATTGVGACEERVTRGGGNRSSGAKG